MRKEYFISSLNYFTLAKVLNKNFKDFMIALAFNGPLVEIQLELFKCNTPNHLLTQSFIYKTIPPKTCQTCMCMYSCASLFHRAQGILAIPD